MSRRVADRWRNPERQGSLHDSAKAAAYRAWGIALASTKDLHEAEFVYTDDMQRIAVIGEYLACLLYTSPSPRDGLLSRMPSCA